MISKNPSTMWNFHMSERDKRKLMAIWALEPTCKCGAELITNENVNLQVCGDSKRHKEFVEQVWKRMNKRGFYKE